MESDRAYFLGKKYSDFHKRISPEGFCIPNGNFVLTNRLTKEDELNVVKSASGNPTRLRSGTVAFIVGSSEQAGTYLVIPNDSDEDTPQMKSERKRLKDLADSF